jgi:hypothetical protein
MVSMPMEDMWPSLDREELAVNMLIPKQEQIRALGGNGTQSSEPEKCR